MTLSCWIKCMGCGRQITLCREIEPRKRYRTHCRRCGADISFTLKSLRWSFAPAAQDPHARRSGWPRPRLPHPQPRELERSGSVTSV